MSSHTVDKNFFYVFSVLTIAVGLVDLSMAVYHRYISDRHLEDSVGCVKIEFNNWSASVRKVRTF